MFCEKCGATMTMINDEGMLRYDCDKCGYAFAAFVNCKVCIHQKVDDDEYITYCRHCKHNPNNDADNFESQ